MLYGSVAQWQRAHAFHVWEVGPSPTGSMPSFRVLLAPLLASHGCVDCLGARGRQSPQK